MTVNAADPSWLKRPPPIRRSPPPRSRSTGAKPEAAPSPAPEALKQVTVTVSGELSIQTFHSPPDRNADPYQLPPLVDNSYRLVDKTEDGSKFDTAMELDDHAGLITGDKLTTGLTLELPKSIADLVNTELGSGNGTRRRLSEQEHSLRRMVLEYHNTERSLKDFVGLQNLIRDVAETHAEHERRRLQINLKDLIGAVSGAGGTQSFVNLTPKAKKTTRTGAGGAKDLMIIGGKPLNITSVTFVFTSSCLKPSQYINTAWVNNNWDSAKAASNFTPTLQRYYDVCSYKKLRFTNTINKVYGPIDFPCQGSWPTKGKYDITKSCADPELYGAWDAAKDFLKKTDADTFKILEGIRRKIFILPFRPVCGFGGRANVGCPGGGDCLTWMAYAPADRIIDMSTIFHELAHNIGLSHSARNVCDGKGSCEVQDYGDKTCFMGSGYPFDNTKQVLCANAPQGYKAGWISPMVDPFAGAEGAPTSGEFKYSDVPMGQNSTVLLPAMGVTDNNFLRIIIDQKGVTPVNGRKRERALFVSYRSTLPISHPNYLYDSGLSPDFNRRVFIHEFNETADNNPTDDSNPPLIRNVLDIIPATGKPNSIGDGWGALPNKWEYAGTEGRLVLRVWSKGQTNATISLCLAKATAEDGDSCFDNLDNDCDGLVDQDDPDCSGVEGEKDVNDKPPPPAPVFKPRSPPPSPPPPSPPPPKTKQGRGRRQA
ncbi:hypothetical protein HXX76_004916 [Chlamydomonas incerta]|uniref:Peptidase M11 gametolysin domain-containing protein n=1 Tax=Chlamydomonas incerta TaxID=51695 RepID=A0A835TAL2_CHLIN|nr:hypothetical protein HXX76_004916 [Chlamydomonas incerta]|eukprot:KAG2439563.1 hypothetical protein HXX76_004916 [Chlamydomonas incerta]